MALGFNYEQVDQARDAQHSLRTVSNGLEYVQVVIRAHNASRFGLPRTAETIPKDLRLGGDVLSLLTR